ncbi:MAG: ATPase domain-containing protein [Methanomassiliicoccales archaeon]|jgi:circadian clock protein KaiC
MAKRFECPRCGAGVRPDDTQCGRCGEVLVEEDGIETRSTQLPSTVTVEKVISEEQTSIRLGQSDYLSISRQKKLLEERELDLVRRSKELADRETQILASIENLEKDTKSLEESVRRFEADDMGLREREEALKEKEAELEALAAKLDKGMKDLETCNRAAEDNALASEGLDRLFTLREDCERTLREDRKRLRKQVEEDLKARLERMDQMEEQLKAAPASLGEKEAAEGRVSAVAFGVRSESEAIDDATIRNLIRDIDKELREQVASAPKGTKEQRIQTHIEKLDAILDGGIPSHYIVLLNGTAGSMKSTIAYHMLHYNAVKNGIRGMYFSLEQTRDSLIRQMEHLGMLREESKENMMVVDMVDLRKSMKEKEGDWRDILLRYVKNVYAKKSFDLFVLDSLESFKALTEFELTRSDLKDLFDWFNSMNLTTLLISERTMDSLLEEEEDELYLADGAIDLIMKEVEHGKVQRWLRCMKMRGVNVDTRYYAFYHDVEQFNLSVPLVGTS